MTFFETEARVSRDPIVGLIKLAGANESTDKLVAVAGVATDNNGKLLMPKAVVETAKEITQDGLNTSYSPASGIPDLGIEFIREILGKDTFEKLLRSDLLCSPVVSSGGANAISSTLTACTSKDDLIISHAPHWPGFASITLATERRPLVNFEMLDEEGNFNIKSLESTIEEVIESRPQQKLTFILNTPFDNPLGQDFGDKAWEQIGDLLSKYLDREILLILDTAYIDYGPGGKDYRRLKFLVDLFQKLNSRNFNLVVAGSASKSFAMYGSRVGVACIFSGNEENVTAWSNVVGGVIRGTISNCSRHGQEIVLNILRDMKKLADVHHFQASTVETISKRNDFFIEALCSKAKAEADGKIIKLTKNLDLIKPDGGFFTSLRLSDTEFATKVYNKFIEDSTYIPLISGRYLRVPTCSLREEILEKVADSIIQTTQELES